MAAFNYDTSGSNFNPIGLNTNLFGSSFAAPTNNPPGTPTAPAPLTTSANPAYSSQQLGVGINQLGSQFNPNPQPAPAATAPTPPPPTTPTATSPWASFSPTYQQNGWNSQEYATDQTANQLAGLLGGSVVKTNQGSLNPFGVPAQNNIDLGAQDTFNAGLLAQRYSSNLMPQWQKDAMTQAELARSGPYTGSASDATNLINRSATPTVAPIAQAAFDNVKKDPVAAAQAATPSGGTGTPAQTTQQQQDQFFGGAQNNPSNSSQNNFLSQLQSILPLLQLFGGFQGTAQQASQATQPSSVQTTPYGYTQWNQHINPANSYSGYQGAYNGSQTAPSSSSSNNNGIYQLLQLLSGGGNRGQGSGSLF